MSAAAHKSTTDATPLPAELPAAALQRLADHGFTTCEQWLALGDRRHNIFGITRGMVAQTDAAVALALRT